MLAKKESPFKHLFIFKSDESQFKKISFQFLLTFHDYMCSCQINEYLNEYEYSLTNE